MLFSLLQGGNINDIIVSLLLTLPMIALALSAHESAHGYVAYKCGDSTAYLAGRLTLNPLKHLDPLGFLFMLIFGYGWAKPVPINPRNFRNPKNGMALSAAAGPGANLILGVICAVITGVLEALYVYLNYISAKVFLIDCVYWLWNMLYFGALINFVFMLFNLIPVPPFDGSRIALVVLPQKFYFKVMRYERQIMIGLLITMLVLSRLFSFSPFNWLAEKLVDLIITPVGNLTWMLLKPLTA